jgi:hypothetical protein
MQQNTTAVESGTGLVLDLSAPRQSQMSLTDIVHALTLVPRFLGGVNQSYSIAQHILLMFELLEATKQPFVKRACLMYFIAHSHIPYIGDVPPQLTRLLELRDRLSRIITRIHLVFARHLVALHNFDPVACQALTPTCEEAILIERLSIVTKAYESFHLLNGGGWTMSKNSAHLLVDVSSELWKASRYVFSFDKMPVTVDSKVVQSKLLKAVDELCQSLPKAITNESPSQARENAVA